MSPLAAAVAALDRSTAWVLVDDEPLAFEAHHPQGLARLGGHWFLSSVEIEEPPHMEPSGRTARSRPGLAVAPRR